MKGIDKDNLVSVINEFNECFKSYNEIIKQCQSNLMAIVSPSSDSLKNIQDSVQPISEAISKMNLSFFDSLKQIKIDNAIFSIGQNLIDSLKGSPLTEDEQSKIITKSLTYSNLGIPFPFNESLGDINRVDVDEKYVSEICQSYFIGENYEKIKESLYNLSHKNEQQVKDAISCFELGNYYACCSVLFEIIDREIILSQPIDKNKRRKVYNKQLIEQRKEYPENENHWWTFFWKINMLQLFSYYYKDGNDFKNESLTDYPVINRNFIAHGTTNRIVDKNDCVKLFLFIYYLKYEIENLIEIC